VSSDLPQPDGDKFYAFTGELTNGQTYVYSQKICKDLEISDDSSNFPMLKNIAYHLEILKNIML
jgi:hypothetical protein